VLLHSHQASLASANLPSDVLVFPAKSGKKGLVRSLSRTESQEGLSDTSLDRDFEGAASVSVACVCVLSSVCVTMLLAGPNE